MRMEPVYKVRLVLTPDPSGGYVVTSPDLPELVSEGDSAAEALANARDALAAVVELYADLGKTLPARLLADSPATPIEIETLIESACSPLGR